jgi:class 3 adenylate cyclase
LEQRASEVIDFIPIAALRDAVAATSKAPAGLAKLTGVTLRRQILSQRLLPSAEIVDLFEQWRYGTRVSFTVAVFLKQPKRPGPGFRSEVEAALAAALNKREATAAERELAITISGEDRFDDGHIVELSFRYGSVIKYLDLDERPQSVPESRFGFAWMNQRDQYVTVTGDERIVEEMLDAIGAALGAHPVRVSFDKRTLDKHFRLDSIPSIQHQNLTTGTRHRVSREGLKDDSEAFDEIRNRDKESIRTGALYAEQIDGVGTVGISVSAERARMNTTRAMSVSGLRQWAAPKLAHLARSLLELRETEPILFFENARDLSLPGVPRSRYEPVGEIAVAVARARTEDLDRVPGLKPAESFAQRLPAKAGGLSSRPHCPACNESVPAQCAACLGSVITLDEGTVTCAGCTGTSFACLHGHGLRADHLSEALTYEPEPVLMTWVSAALVAMGLEVYDASRDSFWIRRNELLYQRKALVPSGQYTALMVDIEGSTPLGRDRASYAELVALLRNAMMMTAREHRGRHIHDGGDGGLLFFPKIGDAIAAACGLQKTVRESEHNRKKALIRIGLATGHIDSEGGRYVGQAINLSDRLQKVAKSGARIAMDAATLKGAPLGSAASARGKVGALPGFDAKVAGAKEDWYVLDACAA